MKLVGLTKFGVPVVDSHILEPAGPLIALSDMPRAPRTLPCPWPSMDKWCGCAAAPINGASSHSRPLTASAPPNNIDHELVGLCLTDLRWRWSAQRPSAVEYGWEHRHMRQHGHTARPCWAEGTGGSAVPWACFGEFSEGLWDPICGYQPLGPQVL